MKKDKLSIEEVFEKDDKEMLYQMQRLFVSSNNLRNLLETAEITRVFRALLKVKKKCSIINGWAWYFYK